MASNLALYLTVQTKLKPADEVGVELGAETDVEMEDRWHALSLKSDGGVGREGGPEGEEMYGFVGRV